MRQPNASARSLPKYESAICIIAGLIGTVALAAGYLGLAIVITAITYIACRSFALFVRNSNNRVQLIGVEIIALLAFATVFQVF